MRTPTNNSTTDILLCTLNAKYIHSAFGLRYLYANLQELQSQACILEYTINDDLVQITEDLLSKAPKIIGFSVYIWNVEQTERLVAMVKKLAPNCIVVLGGPEVSHEYNEQSIVTLADYVITGEGETAFVELCRAILQQTPRTNKILFGGLPEVSQLQLPYQFYSDTDIAHRVIYVEASRGCPFKCQFCLSSLDTKVRDFPLEKFLQEMQTLLDRGARHFKFVDRTFNLKVKTSTAILQFFLDNIPIYPDIFLHFEMVPDRFPTELQAYVQQFPLGSMQFEIGIQTFNVDVASRIERRQDYPAVDRNIQFLQQTGVHLHTDLIIGLPGEDMESFATGFNHLLSLGVEEIQVGILKRLRGTKIAMHTTDFQQIYTAQPPYEVLANSHIPFMEMNRLKRFARYWTIIGNSGRFQQSLSHFTKQASPFHAFLQFSDWLFTTCNRTNNISYNNMLQYIGRYWSIEHQTDVYASLIQDYQQNTGKNHIPKFLDPKFDPKDGSTESETPSEQNKPAYNARQRKHQE